jgi:hypothetical protein
MSILHGNGKIIFHTLKVKAFFELDPLFKLFELRHGVLTYGFFELLRTGRELFMGHVVVRMSFSKMSHQALETFQLYLKSEHQLNCKLQEF